jgi:hypothetical protein
MGKMITPAEAKMISGASIIYVQLLIEYLYHYWRYPIGLQNMILILKRRIESIYQNGEKSICKYIYFQIKYYAKEMTTWIPHKVMCTKFSIQ